MLSIAAVPLLCGIHCSDNDSNLPPNQGTRPWPAPDEGKRQWVRQPRPPGSVYDSCSNNHYRPGLWVLDHPERHRAAWAATIAAGRFRSSSGLEYLQSMIRSEIQQALIAAFLQHQPTSDSGPSPSGDFCPPAGGTPTSSTL